MKMKQTLRIAVLMVSAVLVCVARATEPNDGAAIDMVDFCHAPSMCVQMDQCSTTGSMCGPGKVCCPPMQLKNGDESESTDAQARSSSFITAPEGDYESVTEIDPELEPRSREYFERLQALQNSRRNNEFSTAPLNDGRNQRFRNPALPVQQFQNLANPSSQFQNSASQANQFQSNGASNSRGQFSHSNSHNSNDTSHGRITDFPGRFEQFGHYGPSPFPSGPYGPGIGGPVHGRYPIHEPYGPPHHRGRSGRYGSFKHVYGGSFGAFVPDFYSDAHLFGALDPYAVDFLHKHRYSAAKCGVRPSAFPLDPYALNPHGYGQRPPRKHNFGKHPWQVAVLGWSPEGYGLRCSATLVSPYVLITSAHCLSGIHEPEIKVILGAFDLLSRHPVFPVLERPVAKIFIHEHYSSVTLAHDIALLLMPYPIDFHFTPHVSPACLPKTHHQFTPSKCKIVGWPILDNYGYSQTGSNEVKVTDVTLIQTEECKSAISTYARHLDPTKITPEMHCIKGKEDTHSCIGPGGGALYCEVQDNSTCTGHDCEHVYLAGIVSWSNEYCGSDGLAIVTEVSPYVVWIEELLHAAGGLTNFNPDYFGLPNYRHPFGKPSHHGYGNSGYGPVRGGSHGYGGRGHRGSGHRNYGYGSSGYGSGYGSSGY